jgi:homoserine acetyltransferase
MIMDLSRHTHHSAWHTMHNVICGAAKVVEGCLTVLVEAGVKMCVVHGDRDRVVPVECSDNIKMKAPEAELNIIKNAGHGNVIHGREKEFAASLEHTWAGVSC